MKTTIAIIVLMLSFSSIYAQTPAEGPINTSRSNIRTPRNDENARQTQKPSVTETDEGWEFKNVQLSDDQKTELRKSLRDKIRWNGSREAGSGMASGKKVNVDELLDSGNFFIPKEGLTEPQTQTVLKTKHDTVKNSISNIR